MKVARAIALATGLAIVPAAAFAHGGHGGGGGGGAHFNGGGHMGGMPHGGGFSVGHAPTFSRPAMPAHFSMPPHAMSGGAFGAGIGGVNHPIGAGGFHAAPVGGVGGIGGVHHLPAAGTVGPFGVGHQAGFGYRPGFGYNSLHNINVNNRLNYYGNWYHGNWHGHWGRPWGYWPVGWGWGGGWGWGYGAGLLTAGLMSTASPWGWGYYGYSNPYWGGGGPAYLNYGQPIVAASPAVMQQPLAGGPAPAPQTGEQDQALAAFDAARDLFQNGDYQGALDQTEKALALSPKDPVMHEFRALCLFALADYRQAAAAVHAVLAAGPGWDWTTVSGLYPSTSAYTQQLRSLEDFVEQNPGAAYARFLLAYHYLVVGHTDQAREQLQQVATLRPDDQLASQLVQGLNSAGQAPPEPAPPPEPGAPAQPIDASRLAGDWNSSRPDGSTFEMDLTPDKHFTWTYAHEDQKQKLQGTYSLADNYLILKASDQDTLIGQLAFQDGGKLLFKLAGNNPADPGLLFSK